MRLNILFMATLALQGLAQNFESSEVEKLKQETIIKVRNKTEPLLEKYCEDSCQIVYVDVKVSEHFRSEEDLGFESSQSAKEDKTYAVEKVSVEVQIDTRVTQTNREKLSQILANNLKNFGIKTSILWTPVDIPKIGQSFSTSETLRSNLEGKLESILQATLSQYCPDRCLLSHVVVTGSAINPDEAMNMDPREVVRATTGQSFFHIQNVDIGLSIDNTLDDVEREKILNITKAKTAFVKPVQISLSLSAFPETYSEKREREKAQSVDPYGLDKLRQMLTLFRDLAGTKEIISSNTNSNSSSSKDISSKDMTSSSNTENSNNSISSSLTNNWWMYALAIIVVTGFMLAIIMRFSRANRDAKIMLGSLPMSHDGFGSPRSDSGGGSPKEGAQQPQLTHTDISLSVDVHELKNQLTQIFVENPKVAKETFTRLLEEDGVEVTARYVHIFGKLIIFELLSDPNLSRHLYELSEFYHKSNFNFNLKEELELLKGLKTKVTANEIRVLSRKTSDQFDFLLKLDPTQIYALVADETPQVQSIVLTQLIPRHRNAVFNLFEGENRIRLMNELCKVDAIPKEYLNNVAQALGKKVLSKPEFDTQNLRASEIILELLERSGLDEQKALMKNLSLNNPESARAIKLKLVTIHMIPFLKDGHLLELILGLERDDLLTFLSGTDPKIKDLLLSRAPQELSNSWMEDLDNIAGTEESRYRIVEMLILSRIRNLAATGAINILDINDMLFSSGSGKSTLAPKRKNIPQNSIVA